MISGLICGILFFAVRIEPLFNFFLADKLISGYWENRKYGELYYFNMISHFKEENLPPTLEKYRFSERFPSIDSADILTYGDSFFDFSRMVTFPERLGKELNAKVYYERFGLPLQSFSEKGYQKSSKQKFFLYESAERYIPSRFTEPQPYYDFQIKESDKSKIYHSVMNFIFSKNSEALYNSLLFQSYISKPFYCAISTFKFDIFGYISNSTPKYILNKKEPWLFYSEEVNDQITSFYYPYTDNQIEAYCDNIMDLSKKLEKYYNLKMIFMPIPGKYTIYHTLLNNDKYNDFLPRLYKGLEKRGIPVVKLLGKYKESKEVLYYSTDTHWNQKGLDIALDETVSLLDSIKSNNIKIQ